MTHRILRYDVEITDHQVVAVRSPGRVVSVGVSRRKPELRIDLWALASDADTALWTELEVWVIGTGNPMPDDLVRVTPWETTPDFRGTVITPAGMVWHVWTRLS